MKNYAFPSKTLQKPSKTLRNPSEIPPKSLQNPPKPSKMVNVRQFVNTV
tara:strand:+ start:407 stop:553 length:147 start_codon:yes stop_codon:yes gene_type:complete